MTTYIDIIQKAIDFIEDNLFEYITQEDVSQQVSVSKYHFHRVFSNLLGESVKDYIRKRRLANASIMLRNTNKKILDIAIECQFESQESFSRAFKKMTGYNPGAYRKSKKLPVFPIKEKISLDMISHLQGGITMQPKFVERDEFKVIGIGGNFGKNSFNKISKLWDNFLTRTNEITSKNIKESYGICTSEHPEIKHNEGEFVYIASEPVEDFNNIPEGMVSCTIPKSKYAVFTHKGPLNNLHHTLNYIWGTWLPKCEYQQANSPDFELYDERFKYNEPDSEIDIYIPIK